MENKPTINPIKIAISVGLGALAIRTVQYFYNKKRNESLLKGGNPEVADHDLPKDPIQDINKDYITLKTRKNFEADKKTLCRGVYESKDKKTQYYRPVAKPRDYVELVPKLFSLTAPATYTGNKPDYSETIKPISNALGFIASTPEQRRNNVIEIAKASGLNVGGLDDKGKPKEIDLAKVLPPDDVIEYLARVIALEATSPQVPNLNKFDLDRERIGILWCLVNRTSIGSTRIPEKKRTLSTLKNVAKNAIAYDPTERIKNDNTLKDSVSDCNLTFVKAFFWGFFNDETLSNSSPSLLK